MRLAVTGYTAIVQISKSGGGDHAYVLLIEFVGGNMQFETIDPATFIAWMALLSTGKAMYDPQAVQLVVASNSLLSTEPGAVTH